MTLNDIIKRCSKYSGWELRWEVKNGTLKIFDPKNVSNSLLSVYIDVHGALHEAHGRLRHWAITSDEIEVMERFLKKEED
jgi:hypothetical protein